MSNLLQLSMYDGSMFVQDQELISFADQFDINDVNYIGDSKYVESVLSRRCQDRYKMCVYIVNSPFEFDQIIATCNQELKKLPTNGFLYLALNKFLATPKSHDRLPDNYNSAICQVITQGVKAPLFRYYSGQIDNGQRFNWAHPITRFIFINESSK